MEQLITAGSLLLSDPFLKDLNFIRTAVLVCEHDKNGSFGFVVNKLSKYTLGSLVPAVENSTFPIYIGGPVQTDTLHFIHSLPEEIGGFEVEKGLFWGGNFEVVLNLIQQELISENDIKFFLGYSGWGSKQLDDEITEKSWIVSTANKRLILETTADNIWKNALKNMDGEYALMTNYPLDPQLN